MLIKITLFSTFLLYSFVISQSFFYILAMSNVMKNMRPAAYIESRKLLDSNLKRSLATVYYLALANSILLVGFTATNPSGILFICAVIAFVSLVIDVVLTMKGNLHINKVINTWSASDYPTNWKEYRAKWFSVYHSRQAVNIAGFLSLLTGLIFGL